MKRTAIYILSIVMFFSCNRSTQHSENMDEIAVSILPQQYFVKKIAGDVFKINVMIPPGASPATYEPNPSQISSLSRTGLYLKMGYTGFELAWMEKLSSVNQKMKIIDLSEGIDLIEEDSEHENTGDHHHGGIDPHIWMSPDNVITISRNIFESLSDAYPEREDEFKKNLDAFLIEIDSLDRYINESLAGLKSRSFFIYHPALSYFSRDYDLQQYPLELEGKTPSASHMKNLIDTGKEQKIAVVFMQLQFDQRNAEVLAGEINATIIQFDPLDPDWVDQMVFITDKLKQYLK